MLESLATDEKADSGMKRSDYLCVDLDGTLVATDTFAEAFIQKLTKNPLSVFEIIRWMLEGKASAKQNVCREWVFDAGELPYNRRVLEYIQRERARGAKVILATGADQSVARRIAEHCGCFDEVECSDGRTNLVGEAKAQLLAEKYPGFHYAGDAPVDLAVWERAHGAILVSDSKRLYRRLANSATPLVEVISDPAPMVKLWVRTLRMHQWVKNLLILMPLVASHEIGRWTELWTGLLAIIPFSLSASALYIANDLLDVQNDRRHARKRRRPFASGALSIKTGLGAALLLVLLAAVVAGWIPLPARWLLLFYVLATLAYSARLKRLLAADLIVLVSFYVIRVIYGGYATGIAISVWMLAFSLFFFLALAFVKRLSELRMRGEEMAVGERLDGRAYGAGDANLIAALAGASAYTSVMVLALYINSPEVVPLYRHPQLLWLICVAMIYWQTRVILLANRGTVHDDPIVFAFRDRASYWTGLFIAMLIYAAS